MSKNSEHDERAVRIGRVLGAVGTTLEFYDFALYLYLAPVLSQLFFPSGDRLASLLATYAVFAAGFVIRPLGALFFGHFGDTRGRKAALTLCVAMMAAPMLAIGLLPTNGTIGIAAPILLVLLRLVQGFSVGGEFSGTLVLLGESAQSTRRGFFAAIAQSAAGGGLLLASLFATLVNARLSPEHLDTYGWRLGFLLGAGIGVVALIMRLHMTETPSYVRARAAGETTVHPVREAVARDRRGVLVVFALTGYAGVVGYTVATWVPSFLQAVIGASASQALLATTVAVGLLVVVCPLAGAFSDRAGRRLTMMSAAVALALFSYPLFDLLADEDFARMLGGMLALMGLASWYLGGFSAAVGELFPTRTRFVGLAVGYNLGTAVFSGTAPLVATALVKFTGWELAPSAYIALASVLVLILLSLVREPSHRDLGADGAAPESNRPSLGLPDRTGFEDQLGHRARAAPARK